MYTTRLLCVLLYALCVSGNGGLCWQSEGNEGSTAGSTIEQGGAGGCDGPAAWCECSNQWLLFSRTSAPSRTVAEILCTTVYTAG